MVIGQNPGDSEELAGEPFVGKTGLRMEQDFFVRAGLSRETVSLGNAIRCRWHNSNDLPPVTDRALREAIIHCRREWSAPSGEGLRLIVATGDYACLATTGHASASEWRGWLVPQVNTHREHLTSIWTPKPSEIPVLVTVHVARLFREPSLKPAATRDWQKVSWFLKGLWPRRALAPLGMPLDVWPHECSFDTEFSRTGMLTRYSVSDGGGRSWVIEASDHHAPLRGPRRVIMHNAVADLAYLRELTGHEPAYDDTMLAHSVLNSDLPHDLEYLGSMYSSINRWKHLVDVRPRDYSAGDAIATWDVWQALKAQFAFEPQSEWIYQNSVLPLVPIIERAQRVGLRVNRPRVKQVLETLHARRDTAHWSARAATGIGDFNVGSASQVSEWLYDVEGIR